MRKCKPSDRDSRYHQWQAQGCPDAAGSYYERKCLVCGRHEYAKSRTPVETLPHRLKHVKDQPEPMPRRRTRAEIRDERIRANRL